MTESLSKVLGWEFRNTPAECDLTDFNVWLTSGIPHCGSMLGDSRYPPGAVVSVNSNSKLCQENTLLHGAMRPPSITALFKIEKFWDLMKPDFVESCQHDIAHKTMIHGLLEYKVHNTHCQCDRLPHQCAAESARTCDNLRACTPEFLANINKHLFIDDSKLTQCLKSRLENTQKLGCDAGISQYATHQTPVTAWPSMVVPGGCASISQDPTECGFDNPNLINAGNMLFSTQLGRNGSVGLYVKKIPKVNRLRFIERYQKEVLFSSADGLNAQVQSNQFKCSTFEANQFKCSTFSTFKYKYYIIVSCQASESACEFYESVSRGLSQEEHGCTAGIPPVTIGEFACSNYYQFYLKECKENARRLALKFANQMSAAVPLYQNVNCNTYRRLKVPYSTYNEATVHTGYTENDSNIYHMKTHLLKHPANAKSCLTWDWLFAKACSSSSSSSSSSCSGQEEQMCCAQETTAMNMSCNAAPFPQCTDNQPFARQSSCWEKTVMKVDTAIGVPPMAQEFFCQLEGGLLPFYITDRSGTQRLHSVQIHTNTVYIGPDNIGDQMNITETSPLYGQPKLQLKSPCVLRTGLTEGAAIIRLPPLQGYAVVKTTDLGKQRLCNVPCEQRFVSTLAMHSAESSLVQEPNALCGPLGNCFQPVTDPRHLCKVSLGPSHIADHCPETILSALYDVGKGTPQQTSDVKHTLWGYIPRATYKPTKTVLCDQLGVSRSSLGPANDIAPPPKDTNYFPDNFHCLDSQSPSLKYHCKPPAIPYQPTDGFLDDASMNKWLDISLINTLPKTEKLMYKHKKMMAGLFYSQHSDDSISDPVQRHCCDNSTASSNAAIQGDQCASLSTTPRTHLLEYQPIYSCRYYNDRHINNYMKALYDTNLFPADIYDKLPVLTDLTGNPLADGINPEYLAQHHLHHVFVKPTLDEMFRRCIDTPCLHIGFARKPKDIFGNTVPTVYGSYTPQLQNGDASNACGDNVRLTSRPPRPQSLNHNYQNGHLVSASTDTSQLTTHKQFQPICCINAIPLSAKCAVPNQ